MRALDDEADLECVGHAQTAADARRHAQMHRPDIVLTDVRLNPGGEDCISLTRPLKATDPDLPVIVLTAFADRDLVRPAAAAGASGVLPKDGHLSEVLDVLRRPASAGMVLHPELLTSLLSSRDPPPRDPLPELTSLETPVSTRCSQPGLLMGRLSALGLGSWPAVCACPRAASTPLPDRRPRWVLRTRPPGPPWRRRSARPCPRPRRGCSGPARSQAGGDHGGEREVIRTGRPGVVEHHAGHGDAVDPLTVTRSPTVGGAVASRSGGRSTSTRTRATCSSVPVATTRPVSNLVPSETVTVGSPAR
jgi:CheY-like chemotaxis protein